MKLRADVRVSEVSPSFAIAHSEIGEVRVIKQRETAINKCSQVYFEDLFGQPFSEKLNISK